HGTDITLVGADRSYLPITKYALEQSDGVTAISNYLKQATIEHFGFDRIEVIPNFVCPDEYKPKIDCDLRAALSPDGLPVMVHVSNFRPVKRPVDCVEILARVLRQTKARLVMVGDGSERTNCVHRAKCLGVSDYCVFVGKQPNIVDYLCAFFFQAEDGIRDRNVTGVQTCALPISVTLSAMLALPLFAQDATRYAGPTDKGFLLPNGWTLSPAGDQVTLTDLPLNIIATPDRKSVV